eukprot:1178722-Prorocentrum_minimum.AAC.6
MSVEADVVRQSCDDSRSWCGVRFRSSGSERSRQYDAADSIEKLLIKNSNMRNHFKRLVPAVA